MSDILYSFLVASLSGFATLIGFFSIYVKGDKEKIVVAGLSLAMGVMTTVSLIDLIPTSFNIIDFSLIIKIIYLLFFIMLGIVLAGLIDKSIDNKGKSNLLLKTGMVTLLGITLHNIPEGVATYLVSLLERKLGLSLAITIAIHNIPEGISIAIPIYFATNNKIKTFFYCFIASISELLGAVISYYFLAKFITNDMLGTVYAIIAGIMLRIVLGNILPIILKYKKKSLAYLFFFLGIVIILINHYLDY